MASRTLTVVPLVWLLFSFVHSLSLARFIFKICSCGIYFVSSGCGFVHVQSFFAFEHSRTLRSLTSSGKICCMCNITSCATSVMLLLQNLWGRVFSKLIQQYPLIKTVSQNLILEQIKSKVHLIFNSSRILQSIQELLIEEVADCI